MTQAADIIRSKRRAFAIPGGFHDRLIRFLATALPAAIGVVAAILLLAPLSPRGEVSFLLDRNKVAIAEERIRVSGAQYRGQDKLGRAFSVSAASAAQVRASDPEVRMSGLLATILMADGPARLAAPEGIYNFDRQTVRVAGPVRFTAADGYSLTASGVTIDLNSRRATGTGGISGAIPAGAFSANAIVADLAERSVTLDGNARLHMAPGKLRMP